MRKRAGRVAAMQTGLMLLLTAGGTLGTSDVTLYSSSDADVVSTTGGACIEYGTVEGDAAAGTAYIRWTPNKWHDGRLLVGDATGCLAGTPQLYQFEHVCITLRGGQNGAACEPSLVFTGGYPYSVSTPIHFTGQRALSETEFREVCVPVSELQTADWDLERKHYTGYFRFQKCGTDPQPKYELQQLTLLSPGSLAARAPTPAPTPVPTPVPPTPVPQEIATHVKYGTHWFPLLHPNVIVTAGTDWPASLLADGDCVTVQGSVTYSAASSPKLRCVVVEGGASLTISPAGGDVGLTVGTLVVLPGGVLDITTAPTGHTHNVVITFDGVQDRGVDPQELLIGMVSLEGLVTFTGRTPCLPFAELAETAASGSTELVIKGTDAASCWVVGEELVLPDSHVGYHSGHYDKTQTGYTPPGQTEAPLISATTPTIAGVTARADGNTVVTLEAPLVHAHLAGTHAGHATRSVTLRSVDGAGVPQADFEASDFTVSNGPIRGHVLHTGVGKFDVSGVRFDRLGRTTTGLINSTKIEGLVDYPSADGTLDQKTVVWQGNNQLGRYAVHCHRCRMEAHWDYSVVIGSPRDGMTCHDSRCFIKNNVVVGADGAGIFGEEATETGEVSNNLIIGTGGGTGGGDDGRFATRVGLDMAFGGFGAWFRGPLMLVKDNIAEGIYGVSPYAYFVHPNFLSIAIPDVPGTPAELVGKQVSTVSSSTGFQEYGGFVGNRAMGSWKSALDFSYTTPAAGNDVVDFKAVALGKSGRGLGTTHSGWFRLTDCTFEAVSPEAANMIGVFRNNGVSTRLEMTDSTIKNYNTAIRMFPKGTTLTNTALVGGTVDFKAWPVPDPDIQPARIVGGYQGSASHVEYLIVMGNVQYNNDQPPKPIDVESAPACDLSKVDSVLYPGFDTCACGCADPTYCIDCTRLDGAFAVAKL
eukprot:Hpha_TRINITY_DN15414_c2_g1::TRINITY_DN15414_c2_g1_i3::g.174047::m.174047